MPVRDESDPLPSGRWARWSLRSASLSSSLSRLTLANALASSMISSITVSLILVANLRYDWVLFPQLTSLNVKHRDCIPVTGLIMVGNFMAFFEFCGSKTLSFVKTPEDHSRRPNNQMMAHSSHC